MATLNEEKSSFSPMRQKRLYSRETVTDIEPLQRDSQPDVFVDMGKTQQSRDVRARSRSQSNKAEKRHSPMKYTPNTVNKTLSRSRSHTYSKNVNSRQNKDYISDTQNITRPRESNTGITEDIVRSGEGVSANNQSESRAEMKDQSETNMSNDKGQGRFHSK